MSLQAFAIFFYSSLLFFAFPLNNTHTKYLFEYDDDYYNGCNTSTYKAKQSKVRRRCTFFIKYSQKNLNFNIHCLKHAQQQKLFDEMLHF